MTFDLNRLVRPNVRNLRPYSSARSEFSCSAEIYLDANENSFGSPAGSALNRYPDPLQTELKKKIAVLKKVAMDRIFVGNGSDEIIDLLIRIFCEPGRDQVIVCPPTYGMYAVCASLNDVRVASVPLDSDFHLRPAAVLAAAEPEAKMAFLCSPNNPTGNLMRRDSIVEIVERFCGIVVVDEAYIDFSDAASLIDGIDQLPNLVVVQTFSKAWGLAGARLGIAYASRGVIELMNKIKPPYNVSSLNQSAALGALRNEEEVKVWRTAIVRERFRLAEDLAAVAGIEAVYPSDANFILVKAKDARNLHLALIDEGIVVRDRSDIERCGSCLRITVGTPVENTRLIDAIKTAYASLDLRSAATVRRGEAK